MPESATDKDQAGRAEPRTELSRDLGCFDITMIGVGGPSGEIEEMATLGYTVQP